MMTPRQQVLASIRRSLGVTGEEGTRRMEVDRRLSEAPKGLVPTRGHRPPEERVRLFREMAEGVQASVDEVADPRDVPAAISAYLRNHNLPQRLRRGADTRLAGLPWADTPLDVSEGPSDGSDEVAVSHASGGVAETGTLVMVSGPENPSTLNFLPDTHVVVVDAREIAGDYEAVWDRLRARYGKGLLPRTVNWITGPSRSGDIEQTILLGAHGPRRLHILVVGKP